MMWLVFIAVPAALLWWALHRPNYQIRTAQRVKSRKTMVGGKAFYVEEAQYADYHKAIHFYFELVPQVLNRPNLQEVKYSFLDWCDTTFIFSDGLVKLFRVVDKIYLIQSFETMELDGFEAAAGKIVGDDLQNGGNF